MPPVGTLESRSSRSRPDSLTPVSYVCGCALIWLRILAYDDPLPSLWKRRQEFLLWTPWRAKVVAIRSHRSRNWVFSGIEAGRYPLVTR